MLILAGTRKTLSAFVLRDQGKGAATRRAQTVIHKDSGLKAFQSCNPPEFTGILGAIDAQEWLSRMKTIFQTYNCVPEERLNWNKNKRRTKRGKEKKKVQEQGLANTKGLILVIKAREPFNKMSQLVVTAGKSTLVPTDYR
ncbi:hypothetical protein L1987_18821 [Smallanthus sonchifolius]|uniref:Uncharacterized protein n=1 Tax=Smallanthus sonchifolius TaxID=185202 RepID=A0ACB9J2U4_9ASTR|nr:hypothetical protein L1987_18821 [Smallanthus sonchifolius]